MRQAGAAAVLPSVKSKRIIPTSSMTVTTLRKLTISAWGFFSFACQLLRQQVAYYTVWTCVQSSLTWLLPSSHSLYVVDKFWRTVLGINSLLVEWEEDREREVSSGMKKRRDLTRQELSPNTRMPWCSVLVFLCVDCPLFSSFCWFHCFCRRRA